MPTPSPSESGNITFLRPARPPARRPLHPAAELIVYLSAGAMVGSSVAFALFLVWLILDFALNAIGGLACLAGFMVVGALYSLALKLRGDA